MKRPQATRTTAAHAPLGRVAFSLLASVLGCGGDEWRAKPALAELERLVFVPAGPAPFVEQVVADDLLVAAFETTRGEWRSWIVDGELASDPAWTARLAAWSAEGDTLPASGMSGAEAESFAASRGMRLPTSAEWIAIAGGPTGRSYPWGDAPQDSVANTLELGFHRVLPVGAFETGRSTKGCYDLIGNVWEWASDALGESIESGKRAAFGGSCLYYLRPIVNRRGELNVLVLAEGSSADDVGVRLVADARTYLLANAASFGDDSRARERLIAVGRRFGAAAVPLLESLAARPDAPASLGVLLEGARR